MFEVFFEINKTLLEMRDLMVKMEQHLNDLTMPPDMKAWSKRKSILTSKQNQENIRFANKCIADGKDDDYIFDNLPHISSGTSRKIFEHQIKYMRNNNEPED